MLRSSSSDRNIYGTECIEMSGIVSLTYCLAMRHCSQSLTNLSRNQLLQDLGDAEDRRRFPLRPRRQQEPTLARLPPWPRSAEDVPGMHHIHLISAQATSPMH